MASTVAAVHGPSVGLQGPMIMWTQINKFFLFVARVRYAASDSLAGVRISTVTDQPVCLFVAQLVCQAN